MKTFTKIIMILAAIFLLSFYDYSVHGIEYEKMKKSKSYWKVGYIYIDSIYSNSFYATNRSDTVIGINYKNDLDDGRILKKGDLVSLKGMHLGKDTVNVDFIHFHDGRKWKIILSVIPVVILAIAFFKFFKYDKLKNRIVKR